MNIEIPNNLKYTSEHEWIDPENGWMGITDFAQDELGDIVFVELPSAGDSVNADESFMIVESVKAVSDIYSPVNGTVSDVNDDVIDQPDLINTEPYDQGKLVQFEIDSGLDECMSATEYDEFLE